jgi:hypothetical protein
MGIQHSFKNSNSQLVLAANKTAKEAARTQPMHLVYQTIIASAATGRSLSPDTNRPVPSLRIVRRTEMSSKDIKFLKMTHLKGPNIWTYRPVMEAWIDIDNLEPSNTLPGFNERLQEMLPGLIEHRCSVAANGVVFCKDWPKALGQSHSGTCGPGAPKPPGMQPVLARPARRVPRGIFKVVIRTRNETVGRAALQAARDLVMAAIEDAFRQTSHCRPHPNG